MICVPQIRWVRSGASVPVTFTASFVLESFARTLCSLLGSALRSLPRFLPRSLLRCHHHPDLLLHSYILFNPTINVPTPHLLGSTSHSYTQDLAYSGPVLGSPFNLYISTPYSGPIYKDCDTPIQLSDWITCREFI